MLSINLNLCRPYICENTTDYLNLILGTVLNRTVSLPHPVIEVFRYFWVPCINSSFIRSYTNID